MKTFVFLSWLFSIILAGAAWCIIYGAQAIVAEWLTPEFIYGIWGGYLAIAVLANVPKAMRKTLRGL